MLLYSLCRNSVPNKNRIFMVSRLESESFITNKHFCATIFLSCSQMGQSFSNLLMDIHRGMITWQAWWQMVHGVITWFSMVRHIALKRVFTWSAVCRIIMTSYFAQSMMIMVTTGLCWVTCMNFIMLAFMRFEETGILDLRRLHAVIVRIILEIAVLIAFIHGRNIAPCEFGASSQCLCSY